MEVKPDVSPEYVAWMDAQAVAHAWYRAHNTIPLPQFVADEIARREKAWEAARGVNDAA